MAFEKMKNGQKKTAYIFSKRSNVPLLIFSDLVAVND